MKKRSWIGMYERQESANQIVVSGAAGDIYVTTVLSRKPADILVFDTGLTMTAYTK